MKTMETIASAIEMIAHFNALAEKARVGFFPFSKCTPDNKDTWEDGIVYIDDPEGCPAWAPKGDVVCDCLVDPLGHHDIISSYSSIFSELCEDPVSVELREAGNDPDPEPRRYIRVTLCEAPLELSIVIDGDGWRLG